MSSNTALADLAIALPALLTLIESDRRTLFLHGEPVAIDQQSLLGLALFLTQQLALRGLEKLQDTSFLFPDPASQGIPDTLIGRDAIAAFRRCRDLWMKQLNGQTWVKRDADQWYVGADVWNHFKSAFETLRDVTQGVGSPNTSKVGRPPQTTTLSLDFSLIRAVNQEGARQFSFNFKHFAYFPDDSDEPISFPRDLDGGLLQEVKEMSKVPNPETLYLPGAWKRFGQPLKIGGNAHPCPEFEAFIQTPRAGEMGEVKLTSDRMDSYFSIVRCKPSKHTDEEDTQKSKYLGIFWHQGRRVYYWDGNGLAYTGTDRSFWAVGFTSVCPTPVSSQCQHQVPYLRSPCHSVSIVPCRVHESCQICGVMSDLRSAVGSAES